MPARTAKSNPRQLDREIELARQRQEFVSAAAAAASRVFAGQSSLSDELLKRAESDAFSAVLIHGGPVFGAGSPERTQKLIVMAREGVKQARSQWATRSHATVRAGSLQHEDGTRNRLGKLLASVAKSEPSGFATRKTADIEALLSAGYIAYGLHPRGGHRANITRSGLDALANI